MLITNTSSDLSFLRSTALPSLPAVALEVIRLSQEPEPDLEKISDTVGRDPAFAGRLLKLANSPMFGRSREVVSIPMAMMVLGLNSVRMAAISLSLVPAVGRGRSEHQEVLSHYWRRTICGAVAARQLCAKLGRNYGDEAFLCGVLMDVGVPALLASNHPPYALAALSAHSGHPDPEVERECIGTTHAEAAALILGQWQLPDMIIRPVQHHHDPDGISPVGPPEEKDLARVLSFAHDVATLLGTEDGGGVPLYEARRKGMEWFGLDEPAVDAFVKSLSEDIIELGRVLEVDVGAGDDHELLLAQAQEDLLAMSLGASVELENTKNRMRELQTKASTDALTGIKNRAAFDELIQHHWSVRLTGSELTSIGLIMVDVDKFKDFNDTYGHQAGDEVLKAVARTLEHNTRTQDRCSDAVCRYGGEEFVVVLPDVAHADLLAVTERLRRSVEAMEVKSSAGILKVTASFGGCLVKKILPTVKPEKALKLADENLYAAKEAGRNRCVVSVYPSP